MSDTPADICYICMGTQKMVYNNCPNLAHIADVIKISQAVLKDDPVGGMKIMQFSNWTFHFSSTDYYMFIVGSCNPHYIPFIPTLIAALRQVILLFLGPDPQLGK